MSKYPDKMHERVPPPRDATTLELINQKLTHIMVAGCTCGTKTPDIRYHAEDCHYRLASEIGHLIDPSFTVPTDEKVGVMIVWPDGRRERLSDAMSDLERLRTEVVSGFYEERVPQFRQGAPMHELETPVTASECTAYVNKIEELRALLSECYFETDDNNSYVLPHDLRNRIQNNL